MRTCAKCSERGFRFRGDRWLCVLHNRFDTMQNAARSRGKVIPTEPQLQAMADALIASGMICPGCKIVMQWAGKPSDTRTVSLQHDRSGALRFLCRRCNTRHYRFPGDTFYNYPPDWGYCTRCERALPPTAFYAGKAGACCRECRKKLNKEMWAKYGQQWTANTIARGKGNARRRMCAV